MEGYQFIHLEAYSRVSSKKNKRQSARNVINEAIRVTEASTHISNIKPPALVFGNSPEKALELAEKQAELAKDNIGRKFRKDGLILAAGVASYPARTDEISFDNEDLQRWLKLTIRFLSKKYGEQLKSIVVHSDEPYWHCHFYLVPNLDVNNHLDIGLVHDGISARNAFSTQSAKIKMKAYSDAMRAFQDDYYSSVSTHCGLTRDGPRRRRLTRKEWKIEQAASKRLANNLNISNSIKKRVEYISSELDKKRIKLNRYEKKIVFILKKIGMSSHLIEKITKKINNNKMEKLI